MKSRIVHHLSLVDPALHHPAIADVLDVPVNRAVIDYIVDVTVDTVDYALGRPNMSTRGRSSRGDPKRAKFTELVAQVIARSEVPITVVLVLLAYIDRCKPHLRVASDAYVHERIFLGALIVAAKYLNDSSPKNSHWARYTGEFSKADIGLIEREFLGVLDFTLGITEDNLLPHCGAILSCEEPSPSRRHRCPNVHHFAQADEIEEVLRDVPTSPVSSVDSSPPRTPPSAIISPAEVYPCSPAALVDDAARRSVCASAQKAHKPVRTVAASKPHLVLSDTPLDEICAVVVL
ncbi:hypothetical protein BD626DRAFT_255789 [Schizophyllum amplum]|uniref:Cyclin N-terminal domain-containing protein n=1 Tax=Schizophyllum amplum TaxID=97359 RepID=A0A550CIP3_9AGAR|nr:hypothetical protein BD626DRAFT_255789 [Auriculariopsis ampla]